MSDGDITRTEQDLQRTVRALAMEFKTDKVFIIGSQAILLSWPDAPARMRASPEIDAYPANARVWEIEEKRRDPKLAGEASEHIHALFGEGSQFHETHGFFIDGVDENTAKLPKDWHTRAIVKSLEVDGRVVTAVAPAPEDVIVSKLARFWTQRTRASSKRFTPNGRLIAPLSRRGLQIVTSCRKWRNWPSHSSEL